MKKMKNKLAFLVLMAFTSVTVVGCSGCSAATQWWQNFQKDPIQQVQVFESSVQTVLSVAATTWSSVKAYLPADVAAKAQVRFDEAVAAVGKALVALQDAVQTAVDAKTPSPDFSKVIKDVTDAVDQVIGIINEFKDTPAPSQLAPGVAPKPAQPTGLPALQDAVKQMKRAGGVK